MEETYQDEIGRTYCAKHRRELCHECCFDFSETNRYVEEDRGVRKKRSELEETAKMWAVCVSSLRGMERMVPRPNAEVFAENRQYLKKYEEELQRFAAAGEDVETAKHRALEKENAAYLEHDAMMQAMASWNPGQTHFEYGGPETQRIYDQIAKAPESKVGRADLFTCVFCGKTSTKKLKM